MVGMMRRALAVLGAAGLVVAGATAATAATGAVTRPYTVTISHGGHKTTYRCHTAGVSRGRLGGRGCIPVIRPRVTLDAAHVATTTGDQIGQENAPWDWRVTQPGNPTPDILVIDDVYNPQGFRYITLSNGWDEIQLTTHGGAYVNDCITWNAGLSEYDAIGCQGLVSQQWTYLNYDPSFGDANFENKYTSTCAQAHDSEGEESAITNAPCGSRNNTVWVWNAIVSP